MEDKFVKIDLIKLIRQALPQLLDSKERELFLHWLDRCGDKKQLIEIDLEAVQPAEPGEGVFCPRCGYETVTVVGEKGYCQTCHLRWTVDS